MVRLARWVGLPGVELAAVTAPNFVLIVSYERVDGQCQNRYLRYARGLLQINPAMSARVTAAVIHQRRLAGRVSANVTA